MFFWTIPVSVIGARIWYVIFNLSYYKNNFLDVFKIYEGGLAIHGGIIAGLIFIIYYTKKHKIKTVYMLDFIVPGLILGQAIGRWGNFFNSEAYGAVTSPEFLKSIFIPEFIIEGMNIGGQYYHPTFLYESLWCLVGLIIILVIRRLKFVKIGQITSFYLMWYGTGRFFIEGLRTDSLMLGPIKMAQIISVIMVVTGLLYFISLFRDSNFSNNYNDLDNDVEVKKEINVVTEPQNNQIQETNNI